MKFKVGDKVRIRQWDDMAHEYGVCKCGDIATAEIFVREMKPLCGKKAKISDICGEDVFLEDFEDCEGIDTNWWFTVDMIELA